MKPPMSAEKAKELLAAMQRQTKSKAARIAVLKLALGPHGNLSLEAKTLYQAALDNEVQL